MPFDGTPTADAPPDRFTGKKALIYLVGREWRGFLLIGLTGTFALILGMAAVLLEISGP